MLDAHRTRLAFGAAIAALLYVEPAGAADRALVGRAQVAPTCPSTSPQTETANDAPEGLSAVGPALGAIGAGFVGDVIGAAGNLLGAALEQASRERTFSVEGNASFDYYRILREEPSRARPPHLESSLLPDHSACLILSFGEPAARLGSAQESPPAASVYIEAELQARADGFQVQPVYLSYGTPLAGAPRRALPAEIHAIFSVPGASSADGQPQAFAVARIPLPPIAPGGPPLRAATLAQYSSGVLPARPTAGTSDSILKGLADDLAAARTNDAEIAVLERAIPRARERAAAPNAPADTRTALQALEERLEVANGNKARLDARATWAADPTPNYPIPVGSTNVTVRFALVRDANAFGIAVANALRTRSAQLGTAVATALTPEGRAAAWTASDTNYVTQMSIVDTKQRTLNQAVLAGDAQAIFNAEQDLRLAKAGANAAAAASNRSLPFPGLQ